MAKWDISCFRCDGIKGVYCILSIDENMNRTLWYIGSSSDIGKRVTNPNHHYRKLFDAGISVYIKYKECDDYVKLEKRLINRLKPILNIQHK